MNTLVYSRDIQSPNISYSNKRICVIRGLRLLELFPPHHLTSNYRSFTVFIFLLKSLKKSCLTNLVFTLVIRSVFWISRLRSIFLFKCLFLHQILCFSTCTNLFTETILTCSRSLDLMRKLHKLCPLKLILHIYSGALIRLQLFLKSLYSKLIFSDNVYSTEHK